jgi:hypothetical protein
VWRSTLSCHGISTSASHDHRSVRKEERKKRRRRGEEEEEKKRERKRETTYSSHTV